MLVRVKTTVSYQKDLSIELDTPSIKHYAIALFLFQRSTRQIQNTEVPCSFGRLTIGAETKGMHGRVPLSELGSVVGFS